jgi:hypothetical protein
MPASIFPRYSFGVDWKTGRATRQLNFVQVCGVDGSGVICVTY